MCLWQVGGLHLALQKYDILGVGDKVQWVERLLTTHRAPSLARVNWAWGCIALNPSTLEGEATRSLW